MTPRFFERTLVLLLCTMVLGGCVDHAGTQQAPGSAQTRDFDLYVSLGPYLEPTKGKHIDALAFGLAPDGPFTVPGPAIHVTEGDHVRVRLHDGFHTIHWHGYAVPWAMDGVPYMTQAIGTGTYVYEFDAKETGTYWYHCHVDAPTHIDAGLFGSFIVDPADRGQDPAFSRDYTLMLHETDSVSFVAADAVNGVHQPSPADFPSNPQDAADAAQDTARTTGDLAGLIAGDATGQYGGSAGPRDYYPQDSLRYRPHYDTFM
ncbi:MAG: multicopper oxidase domain-containing protein, partial [Thermoplasmatota archaeon]